MSDLRERINDRIWTRRLKLLNAPKRGKPYRSMLPAGRRLTLTALLAMDRARRGPYRR